MCIHVSVSAKQPQKVESLSTRVKYLFAKICPLNKLRKHHRDTDQCQSISINKSMYFVYTKVVLQVIMTEGMR